MRIAVDRIPGQIRTREAGPVRDPMRWALKRQLDIIISLFALVILSPILPLAALAVKSSSPGPVFFTQDRCGLGERRYRMYKFRTMRVASVAEMQDAGILLKCADHPRITRVGRVLRKTSIDELPQLFNVLRGEMSLVGPRPLIPEMLTVIDPKRRELRARVRPGITGLWQLRDRRHASSALSMINSDLEYVETYSMWLDVTVLLQTIPAVLSCRGAA